MNFTKEEEEAIKASKLHLEELEEILRNNPNISSEDFYKEYYNKIGVVYSHHQEIYDNTVLYRSRTNKNITEEDVVKVSAFSYRPIDIGNTTPPSIERLNVKGQSIFYASFSPETNFKEIDKNIKAGTEIFISRWKIKNGENINCYNLLLPNNVYAGVAKLDEITINDPDVVNSVLGDYIKCVGRVCLGNEFPDDRKYYISSLLANHIYNFKTDGVYLYEGIMYPSSVIGNGKVYYTNIALTPNCVDKKLSAQWVIKGRLMDDMKSISPLFYGKVINGDIKWFSLDYIIDYSKVEIIGFFDNYGEYLFEKFKNKDLIEKFQSSLRDNLLEQAIKKIHKDIDGCKIAINYQNITNILTTKMSTTLTCNLSLVDGYFSLYKLHINGRKITNGGIIVKCAVKIDTQPSTPKDVIEK